MGIVRTGLTKTVGQSNAQVVTGSLRFDSSKSNYLSRTPGSAGNRQTWTWSGWVKRNSFGVNNNIFSGVQDGNNGTVFYFDTNNCLAFFNYVSGGYAGRRVTTNVYRDSSSWYHILLVWDSTNATVSNRIRIYVNGIEVTTFSTNTDPSSANSIINSTNSNQIGADVGFNNGYSSLQISNAYFIDGQALDPSYFGFTDPLTNTWRPKKLKSGAATVNDGRTWSSNYGNLRTAGTQTNPFDADNTNYAQVSVGGGGYFTFPDGLNGRLEVLASTGQSTDGASTQTVTISNNSGAVASRTTSKGYNTGPEAIDFGVVSGITSVFLTDSGLFWGFRINSITLRDGVTETIGFGTNGFHLPMDGNTPIGQDQSGRGNNWTPVNFGGSNTIEKATGALPILNTDGGGKVARVGVRTDSNASSLVLALPLVGIKSDFSNAINSGTSNKAVTVNGNAAASNSQSNFYGGSFAFDGTGDYLTAGTSSDYTFGTGDFTVECFVYFNASGSYQDIFSTADYNSTNLSLRRTDSNQLQYYINDSLAGIGAGGSMLAGRWYHTAITRNSGTLRLFVDGVVVYSATQTFNLSTSGTFTIGRVPGNALDLNGYIQDLRVYKGVAKYTQNFIPASTDPDILPDTPSGVAYSSNVTAITDGAVAFDGSGDYLSIASNADFDFGSGDCTVECFLFISSHSGDKTIIGTWEGNISWQLSYGVTGSNDRFGFSMYNGSTTTASSSVLSTAYVGRWVHLAGVRNGNTLQIWVNGVLDGTASFSGSHNAVNTSLIVGGRSSGNQIAGFLSNVHVVKGTALYTSNFTPPTAPITSVANTKLLCCKSNSSATVYDVSPGTITANGNAAASNFNPFTVNINTQRGQESGWCTLDPLKNLSAITLSNGNLDLAFGSATNGHCSSTVGVSTGRWYWEYLETAGSSLLGISNTSLLTTQYPGQTSTTYSYFGRDSQKVNNGSFVSYGQSFTVGDTIGVAFDATGGTLSFYKNGVNLGVAFSGISNDTYFPAFSRGADTPAGKVNFGQKPFKFPPPAGFQPLALANTPRPTIVRPDQYVGIATYTGNGGTQSINVGWKPDFVWIKNRDAGDHNGLFDSIRGPLYRIVSDYTYASTLRANTLTSFNTNGFTVGSAGEYNRLNERIVAWVWKAGGNSNTFNINDIGYSTASAAGLTAGTITPTAASINTKSGFSVITWNGSGSSGTLSHGLGNTPGLILLKGTSSGEDGQNWRTYHSALGTSPSNTLFLNLTNASSSNTERISAVGTSTFTLSSGGAGVNASGQSYIAYLWAEISGFSKFGSYTGNGSSDGPMVVTGFRPRWILLRETGNADYWFIFDTERSKTNPTAHTLWADQAQVENWTSINPDTTYNNMDILSNGFKLRSSYSATNRSSGNYIYAAFAETPSFNLYGGQSNAR